MWVARSTTTKKHYSENNAAVNNNAIHHHLILSDYSRYVPAKHSSYYDTSGSYYNLMTDSKHSVEEPRMVEKQIEELLEEEVNKDI